MKRLLFALGVLVLPMLLVMPLVFLLPEMASSGWKTWTPEPVPVDSDSDDFERLFSNGKSTAAFFEKELLLENMTVSEAGEIILVAGRPFILAFPILWAPCEIRFELTSRDGNDYQKKIRLQAYAANKQEIQADIPLENLDGNAQFGLMVRIPALLPELNFKLRRQELFPMSRRKYIHPNLLY